MSLAGLHTPPDRYVCVHGSWGPARNLKSSPNEPLSRCKSMSNNFTFRTAGGRITCTQCQAQSKRTKQQCRAPASRGKILFRFHGSASTGPKTHEGRARCAAAKTVHGFETRKTRNERAEGMRRLHELEDLGYRLGIMSGPRMPGRKPR